MGRDIFGVVITLRLIGFMLFGGIGTDTRISRHTAFCFRFDDINYAVAGKEDKEAMFLEYSERLNSLDSGATTKITINNRRINKSDFENTRLDRSSKAAPTIMTRRKIFNFPLTNGF